MVNKSQSSSHLVNNNEATILSWGHQSDFFLTNLCVKKMRLQEIFTTRRSILKTTAAQDAELFSIYITSVCSGLELMVE